MLTTIFEVAKRRLFPFLTHFSFCLNNCKFLFWFIVMRLERMLNAWTTVILKLFLFPKLSIWVFTCFVSEG